MNIELIRGDGHIVQVPCATEADGTGVAKVRSSDLDVGELNQGVPTVCFQVLGTEGYLELRIPNVFEISGDGTHDLDATVENQMTGQTRSKHVEADESQQFGWTDAEVCDASDPDYPESCEEMLLELRVAG